MMVRRAFGASVIVLAVVAGACTHADVGGGVAAVSEQRAAAGVAPVVANFSSSAPVPGAERSDLGPEPVRLLTEPIPPCVPLEGLDHDPCGPGVPAGVASSGPPPFVWDPPSVTQIMSGFLPAWVTHIVVRATVRPGTTRCDGYLIDLFDYISEDSYGETRAYKCFVDVRVNEYLLGGGPTELTVGVHRNIFFEMAGHTWEHDRDYVIREEFENPAVQVANAYEGREVVLFLAPTQTITVESWSVAGHYDLFFVIEDTDSVAGQSRDETSGTSASEPRYRAVSRWENSTITNIALDELVTSVKAAVATRTASTPTTTTTSASGQSRSDTSSTTAAASTTTTTAPTHRPPYLVTRADQLRAFYIAGGAVYEGDDPTTVLPPPAPVPPGKPTNIEKTIQDGRILITWDPPTHGGPVDEYRLWLVWAVAGETNNSFYNVPSWQGEPSFEITYVVKYLGSAFTVQVRAGNNHGYSPWTAKQTFTSSTPSTTTTPSTTATSPTTSTTVAA